MPNPIEVYDFIELKDIKKSNYVYNFPPNEPLILGDHAAIALKEYFLWYTLPNISEHNKNNKVTITHTTTKTYTIPDGMYEVQALSDYLNRMVVLNREVLGPNELEPNKVLELSVDKSTLHCLLRLDPGVKIDFTQGQLYELLGFEPEIYNSSAISKNLLNITRGVDQIYFRCDLVHRNYQYEYRDVLYTILPNALPGEALMERIEPLEFYPCKNRFIRSLNINITDKEGNEILLSESVSIKLVFKHYVESK